MKYAFFILITLLSCVSLKAQNPIDLGLINLRMDNYDFQFLCPEGALKHPNPDEVTELYIYRCENEDDLTSFPRSILKFKNLRILIIRYDIGALPPDIDRFKQLEVLIVWSDSIKYLPYKIGNLKKLRYLDMSFNKISYLPLSFSKLQNLEYLDISDNKFKSFPHHLRQLPKLRHAGWSGNPCNLVPQDLRYDKKKKTGLVVTCHYEPNKLRTD